MVLHTQQEKTKTRVTNYFRPFYQTGLSGEKKEYLTTWVEANYFQLFYQN